MADRKLAAMHKVYGKLPGHICADCPHLACHEQSRRWYKCKVYGESNSAATDWAKSWTACGLWGKSVDRGQIALIEQLKRGKRPDNEQIEGQISMFEGVEE